MPNSYEQLSALSIAEEISNGTLSATDAIAHSAKMVAAHEQELLVFNHFEEGASPNDGPLTGIAVGVKDIFDTYDMPSEYNSAIYKGYQPTADASIVAMLREAGATIVGKTVTTEYAFFEPGPTRNPHNPNHTPGGSSSGSAAGVAAGYFPAAVGTQTGGSVIRPASFCGVSGFKPSFRLFPTVGFKCFSWSLDTVGFFAKTAADIGFVTSACSGRDLTVDTSSISAPRIGILSQSVDADRHVDMTTAFNTCVDLVKKSDASTMELELPEGIEAGHEAHAVIQNYECVRALAHERIHHNQLLSERLQKHLESSANISAETYDDARRTANHARKQVHSLFEKCDVLLTPSALGPAPEGLTSTGDPAMNRLWSLLGLPTVNVPGLKSDDGLPLGMQIIAPFGRDKQALQAAHWLEKILA